MAFSQLVRPASVAKNLDFRTVVFPLKGENDVSVAGVSRGDADAFVSFVNAASRHHFVEQVGKADAELHALAEVVARLEHPRRYPSACLLEPFLVRASQVLNKRPESIPDGVLPDDQREIMDAVLRFQEAPQRIRDAAVKVFADIELAEMPEFMDTIESNSLTPEQRLAVVTDEDATLVLAGADSGETSVNTAKTAYLFNRGIRKPDQILLMAFGKDAAAEMASRIEERWARLWMRSPSMHWATGSSERSKTGRQRWRPMPAITNFLGHCCATSCSTMWQKSLNLDHCS